ncbi:ATP-binding cassette sub-family C member 5-like [Amphiura filiformis]|uniref:ATP-binding cassette sub-family C member 5-like n=1 Tax=Amphiura filiformis TaxID=82378 RepID=UPI003B222F16
MAFAAQRPWIQNATLRDNILCGHSMDRKRYDQVISACALEPDIALLPAGDLTEIGERGVTLSGGQKQRVNMARAIYSNAEMVLLDDPLSSLDVHVGGHVFESGIMGLLRECNRTVVLVTNQLQYLQHADVVIVIEEGEITHRGPYNSLSVKNQWWSRQFILPMDRSTDINNIEEERALLQKQINLKRGSKHANGKEGPDAGVSSGGENFSVGERQLFCLARAFLRRSRILIMDEATASIDTETGNKLHELLTTAFADRTVITIAHRVDSILESDRIVVMSKGKVVEFDTPNNLLDDKDGVFSSLVLASERGQTTL